ncbi:MAG: ADP-ribosylation factor-like protein [Candidatus Thorarchaeota archaeon]
MIHNVFLYETSTGRVLQQKQYWPVNIGNDSLREFVSTRKELRSAASAMGEIPLVIGAHKMIGFECGFNLLFILAADRNEDEHSLQQRATDGARRIASALQAGGIQAVMAEFDKIVDTCVISRLKIALVGEGGVGKTTTLRLLLGDAPPLQYVPTIALNLETVENIRFGSYSLVIWDFAGQERFRILWRFYSHGADVIFLVCDSTLRNVLISKDILKLIRRDAPKVPVFAIANKQDKPDAMKPEVIQKILGIPTYPMVAIDKNRRTEMLRILLTAAAQYVGIVLPDLPAHELVKFKEEAGRAAITQTQQKRNEEVVEVVEEVLVDEFGNVVEEGEDFEVVEEIVEEVDVPAAQSANSTPVAGPAMSTSSSAVDTAVAPEYAEDSVTPPDSEIMIDIDLGEEVANGTDLAVQLLSQQLGEDETIVEDLKKVDTKHIDEALEAMVRCDEVVSPDGEIESPHTVDERARAELEEILESSKHDVQQPVDDATE